MGDSPDHARGFALKPYHRAPKWRRTIHALIIEDEALIAITIEDALRQCGFTSFDFAISKDDAVRSAKDRTPDLITADVELRPGSGIDAVNEICRGQPIPVVFVTASPHQVIDRMPQHLMVLKPFGADDLIAIVRVALGRTKNGERNEFPN